MNEELTEEEQRVIKELARNLAAASTVGRFIRTAILWLASMIGGGWVVWEFLLKVKH